MNNFRLNLHIIGFEDTLIGALNLEDIVVMRKGDVWNKRTGKQFTENSIEKTVQTTYEEGFGPALDKMIQFIVKNPTILNLIKIARLVSFQICVDLDDECNIPYIGVTKEQIAYLAEINAELEFHIS
jgi:hypothetical protein